MGSLRFVAVVVLLGSVLLPASPAFAQASPTYGVGRAPTADEIRALDISIGPTGEELPPGRGTAKEGVVLFEEKGCVACHGEAGIGGLAPSLHYDNFHGIGRLVTLAAELADRLSELLR